jgi:hypothetical protein
MLTLADLATNGLPLLVGSPECGAISLALRLCPKDQRVNATIGFG